jgi:salicylate hydroxylase
MIEGAGWAMYPISGGKEVNIVAFIQDEKPWIGEQAAREVTREEMEAEFMNFDHRLRKLLDVSIVIRKYKDTAKQIHSTSSQ